MKSFIRIGIDLAKNFFQVHAIEREGAPAVARKLSRGKVLGFFAQAAPCRVGMEACGSSHYWAREIQALGHEVVLIPPAYTKPYVKRGKNDANDAAAICEAMSRPDMRFVPIKSADQQAVLMLHKTRELLVKQRTMTVNALRGHLSEFGLIAPKGIHRVKELLALALADETLPEEAKQASAMLAWPPSATVKYSIPGAVPGGMVYFTDFVTSTPFSPSRIVISSTVSPGLASFRDR